MRADGPHIIWPKTPEIGRSVLLLFDAVEVGWLSGTGDFSCGGPDFESTHVFFFLQNLVPSLFCSTSLHFSRQHAKKGTFTPCFSLTKRVVHSSLWGAALHTGRAPREHLPAPQPHAKRAGAVRPTIIFLRHVTLGSTMAQKGEPARAPFFVDNIAVYTRLSAQK